METTTEQPSIQGTFEAHHRRLECLFEEVLSTLRAGDSRETCRLWGKLDAELTEHMAIEERELFPRLAQRDPGAVDKLLAQHAELRREIAELGATIDLHRITESLAQSFFDRLKQHAAIEDRLLYRWADRQLGQRASIVSYLRQAISP